MGPAPGPRQRATPADFARLPVESGHQTAHIGIDPCIRWVLIEIERQLRSGQAVGVDRQRALGLLPLSRRVRVEVRQAKTGIGRKPIEPVQPVAADAVACDARATGIHAQGLQNSTLAEYHRTVGRGRPVASRRNVHGAVGLAGRVMDHVDRSGKGGRAVEDRSTCAQHFDPFDVVQVQRGKRGDERAADRNAVDQQQKIIRFATTQHRRRRAGWPEVPAGIHADAPH